MDLTDRIDELQVLLEEAKAVPLSGSAVVNRDELMELLADLKQALPDEVRQARWVVRDRDELMERARREAQRIVAEAEAERDRLVSSADVVRAAREESERILAAAAERSESLKAQAEDYVDAKLASFENLLNRTLSSVTKGREQLRQPGAAAGPGGPGEPLDPAAASSRRRPPPFNVEGLQEAPAGDPR